VFLITDHIGGSASTTNQHNIRQMAAQLERYVSDNVLQVSRCCLVDINMSNANPVLWSCGPQHCRFRYCVRYALFHLAHVSLLTRALASSSKSPDSLFSSLHASGLPDTPDAHRFITELYNKVPRKQKHKQSSDSARRQAEQEAKALQAQKFSFLLEDEKQDVVTVKRDKGKGKEKEKEKEKREKHLRKREHDGHEWESDEEEQARKRWKSEQPSDEGRPNDDMALDQEEEDEETRREREREADLKERDEFAERMRNRDKEKTKKLVEDHSTKGAAAEAAERRRLGDDSEARTAAMPSLRLHSRQEYLTKREIQQIELLRREIADDEALFAGMKISKREMKELERKKDLLRLVEERLKINDKWEGYMLPEDYITEQGKIDKKRKNDALYKRYEESKPKDDQFVTDVDQWEAAQAHNSAFKVGAMDKKEIVEEYDYVFDESQTIKFVMDATIPGTTRMTPAERMLQQQIEEAEKRGALSANCSSPPFTYPCRQLNQSKRPGKRCPSTSTRNNSLRLYESIKSWWLSQRQGPARRPNFRNTSTKLVSQRTGKRLDAHSLVELLPCP